MSKKRNRKTWVLEPDARISCTQQIGGLFYDFIDDYSVELSNGTYKQLLSCVREETRMSDRTLQRIFLGKVDSVMQYLRILAAIYGWIPVKTFQKLWSSLGDLLTTFFFHRAEQFLEDQALLHRPKRKGNAANGYAKIARCRSD